MIDTEQGNIVASPRLPIITDPKLKGTRVILHMHQVLLCEVPNNDIVKPHFSRNVFKHHFMKW